MSVTIRNIKKEDNPIIAELIRKIFREFKIDKQGTVYTDPSTDALYELFQAEGASFVKEKFLSVIYIVNRSCFFRN